jgi:rare lipoprotein A
LCLFVLLVVSMVIPGASAHHRVSWGRASYYANYFSGQKTACGIRYRPRKMIAAHRSLPCGTRLKVKNRATGRIVRVTVQDRGPFGSRRRILDVSRRAARRLHFYRAGVAKIRVAVIHPK